MSQALDQALANATFDPNFNWRDYAMVEGKTPADTEFFAKSMDVVAQTPEGQELLRQTYARYGMLPISGTGIFHFDGQTFDFTSTGGGFASVEPRLNGGHAGMIYLNLDSGCAFRGPNGEIMSQSLVQILYHEIYHIADPDVFPPDKQAKIQDAALMAARAAIKDFGLDEQKQEAMAQDLAAIFRKELKLNDPYPTERDLDLVELPVELAGLMGGYPEKQMKNLEEKQGYNMTFSRSFKQIATELFERHELEVNEGYTAADYFDMSGAIRAFTTNSLYLPHDPNVSRDEWWKNPTPRVEEAANDGATLIYQRRFNMPGPDTYQQEGVDQDTAVPYRDIPIPTPVPLTPAIKLSFNEFTPENLGQAPAFSHSALTPGRDNPNLLA